MPNIKTYDQPALEIRPTEVGIESTAAAARRSGAFFNQAAAAVTDTGQRYGNVVSVAGNMAVKYIEHRELTAGAAQFAQMQDGILNAWNEVAKDPETLKNPNAAAEFRGGMEPALNRFRESFITEGGQKWAQAHTDRLREHMFAKTSADMATLGGVKTQQEALGTINTLGNTVYSNPESLAFQRETLRDSINAWVATSNATGVQAAKMRTQLLEEGENHLVNQAVRGAIAKGGDGWKKLADDPKNSPFLDRAKLETAAKTQQRADLLTQKQIETMERQERERQFSDRQTKIFSDNIAWDSATNRPVLNPNYFKQTIESSHMPGADAATIAARLTWGEHQQRLKAEPVVSDPAVKQDLTDRMFSLDNPTTELQLMKANTVGGLSDYDFRKMHALQKLLAEQPLKDEVFKDTLHGAKALLGTDPIGQGKYASFVQDFIEPYLTAKRAGTLPPSPLDLNNPDSMIRQAMKPYQRSALQIITDMKLRGLEVSGAPSVGAPATVEPPPAPDKSTVFVPPPDWQWSPSRRQYRDPAGNTYDPAGKRVKQ